MATIKLYATYVNQMPSIFKIFKNSVVDYQTELSGLKTQLMAIPSSICSMDDIISSIQTSTQTQEQKATSIDLIDKSNEEFTEEVVKTDIVVAETVEQRKDDFYTTYTYLKPEYEKNWLEKIGNWLKSVAEWCKEHWRYKTIKKRIVVTKRTNFIYLKRYGELDRNNIFHHAIPRFSWESQYWFFRMRHVFNTIIRDSLEAIQKPDINSDIMQDSCTVVDDINNADVETRKKYIWDYLIDNFGVSEIQAAAIMGNMEVESGFYPTNAQNYYYPGNENPEYVDVYDINDNVAWGLIQWKYYSRKQGLLDYATEQGKSVGDTNVQLEYLYYELLGEGGYSKAFQNFLNITDIDSATIDFARHIEQTGNPEDVARQEAARRIYKEFCGE